MRKRGEKSARRAAPHRTLCPGIMLKCRLRMYTMLHKSLQLSQISMLTLTVTPSRRAFGFFRKRLQGAAASVQRREYDAGEVQVRLSGCSGLNEAAMPQHECGSDRMNTNVAIVRRWMSRCCANSMACIPHHECRGSWRCMNIEALLTSVQKFMGPIHARK